MKIKLVKTCEMCPEQYDAFDEFENQVGYLRLRNGYFYVCSPDINGKVIYSAYPDGDGTFRDYEREKYLKLAIEAIQKDILNRKK